MRGGGPEKPKCVYLHQLTDSQHVCTRAAQDADRPVLSCAGCSRVIDILHLRCDCFVEVAALSQVTWTGGVVTEREILSDRDNRRVDTSSPITDPTEVM